MSELKNTTIVWVILGTVAVGLGCPAQGLQPAERTRGAEPSKKVRLLRVPDRGIQPQVVLDGKGTVHMVYFKGEA